MLDWTKDIQTRGGLEVRVLCDDLKGSRSENYVVAITLADGSEAFYAVYSNGRYHKTSDSSYDIVNRPETRVLYVNAVYRHATLNTTFPYFDAKSAQTSANGRGQTLKLNLVDDKIVSVEVVDE